MKYEWVRMPITTHNRDRQGGHGPTYVEDGGWMEPMSPRHAKYTKKRTRKMQRRQHQKVTSQALYEMECDVHDYMMEDIDDYYQSLDDAEFLDYLNDQEVEEDYYEYDTEYDYSDPMDFYDPYDYGTMDYDLHPLAVQAKTPSDHIIKFEDLGKTLSDLIIENLMKQGYQND